MSRQYLLGILVYNGVDVVPRCLESAARLVADNVTVMVFDDCSPAPGWSDEVRDLSTKHGLQYYRSPRNLGIPRNMSLVMRTALTHGYEIAGLVNSDVVLPENLIATMDAVLDSDGAIASVTPWSNNVSSFSLPMAGADHSLADPRFVSEFAAGLFATNAEAALDIPTGVGYCMMIPTVAIRDIGVMDPIFGRGYCEEVDWCQRARLAGWRNVLSLGSFVYHEGSGTNRAEGLLAHGMTTVIENELIIRGRYPDYMERVIGFFADGAFARLGTDALARVLRVIIADHGFELVLGDPLTSVGHTERTVTLAASGPTARARLSWHGLSALVDVANLLTRDDFLADFGRPTRVTVVEPGRIGEEFAAWARDAGVAVTQRLAYPTRV